MIYRYVFRVRPFFWALLGGAFLLALLSGCANRPTSKAVDKEQKEATRKVLEAQLGDADAAIRKYTSGQMQHGKKQNPVTYH